jgi:hypothetical protein
VKWPDAIRLLACIDNLLWFFEQRIEPSPNKSFAEFVTVLVAALDLLLRKQEAPGEQLRKYSLELLSQIGALFDSNKGAVVEVKNPKELQIYLIKDRMREDSETFGLLLFKEVEAFVSMMESGIRT